MAVINQKIAIMSNIRRHVAHSLPPRFCSIKCVVKEEMLFIESQDDCHGRHMSKF